MKAEIYSILPLSSIFEFENRPITEYLNSKIAVLSANSMKLYQRKSCTQIFQELTWKIDEILELDNQPPPPFPFYSTPCGSLLVGFLDTSHSRALSENNI